MERARRSAIFLLALVLVSRAALSRARGRWANRYLPNMFAPNLDSFNGMKILAQHLKEPPEEILDEETLAEMCADRKCTSNEHCCQGWVCVFDQDAVGACEESYGQKLGEACRRTADCEPGLTCRLMEGDAFWTCHSRDEGKGYNARCNDSHECDIEKGLCCQLVRTHRMAPRKVCQYFKDPLTCIGSVNINRVRQSPAENTAGERRVASRPVDFF